MGKEKGFIKIERSHPEKQAVDQRIKHYREFEKVFTNDNAEKQSERCMDCGVAFCHHGCPLENKIPDFNNAVYEKNWKRAFEILDSTNNFPEFTGRICPAPCEASCVLSINNDAVNIEQIEKSIAEKAFKENWVKPKLPEKELNKKIAIVGSGPAGLACAEQLRSKGYAVDIYEKESKPGGLLRYGIPNFKLEKQLIDRRIDVLKAAEIQFFMNRCIGKDIHPKSLLKDYEALVLCIGSEVPRDLKVEGRHLKGIHFAMDFLTRTTKKLEGLESEWIDCNNKNVLVIGGGDTGSDCIGTANRMGAKNVIQLELLSKPPYERTADNPWPDWPMILKTTSSHEEGSDRKWAVATKRFISDDGVHLSGAETIKLEWRKDKNGIFKAYEVEGTQAIIDCDIVFLAIGFVHPLLEGFLSEIGLALDKQKNIKTTQYQSSVAGLFTAGDAHTGQSLVVNAIAEGRKCANAVHAYLNEDVSVDIVYNEGNPFAL